MTANDQRTEAVYIHIPFCTNKCFYCDFNSYVLKDQPVMDYLRALDKEMELTVQANPPGRIKSIFVGGGTPTVLKPNEMEYFLQSVKRHFPEWSDSIEFSMEANPGTTDLEKLSVMRQGGVNRISFGVQAFQNTLLTGIGRIHDTDDVYRSLDNARRAGFDNMSIDLMFGLPNQTLDMLAESVDKALELELPHYSIYSLKVEENTLFHTMYQRNQLPLPDEEDELNMYLLLMERMKAAGYKQYEISNFAKPGFESRHNMTYWRNEDYYGLGAGAHGYVGRQRHVNIKGVNPYNEAANKGLPRLESFEISKEEAMEDFLMVGLRVLDGVSRSRFREQFGISMEDVFAGPLNKMVGAGLLDATEDGYKLSSKGILFGNDVFGEFIGSLTTN
ncbi:MULTISPECIES: radical SAM family heme chaperone HemW [Paenibacillus]|uniref:radical SAM family heme chaperone HemW n=1 Tax=Paenibacillus TaxID=44249 RepID=UPI000BBE012F|nr:MULTISPECIES: radical SAM family heme chaperone HemW [Paenibacillus]PCL94282.1 coproporphyrinogen III oxidase [Paenibacillus lautus]QOT07831.1 oxygen-independent coproporphyrinogen III oxidase [Paenibacillus sp. JNUCC-32]WFB60388.1 radical SAM family heme chaperone HemW [Paenibacillus sp. BR1-192]GIP01772.1 oxygen-independent coproporphyrinogen-III oxidase-like protein YqeR [Paenibacillus lautus]